MEATILCSSRNLRCFNKTVWAVGRRRNHILLIYALKITLLQCSILVLLAHLLNSIGSHHSPRFLDNISANDHHLGIYRSLRLSLLLRWRYLFAISLLTFHYIVVKRHRTLLLGCECLLWRYRWSNYFGVEFFYYRNKDWPASSLHTFAVCCFWSV